MQNVQATHERTEMCLMSFRCEVPWFSSTSQRNKRGSNQGHCHSNYEEAHQSQGAQKFLGKSPILDDLY